MTVPDLAQLSDAELDLMAKQVADLLQAVRGIQLSAMEHLAELDQAVVDHPYLRDSERFAAAFAQVRTRLVDGLRDTETAVRKVECHVDELLSEKKRREGSPTACSTSTS